ncbi:MAG: DUF2207 domain-containing protein [Candidatus Berkelbacteria bacterium]
MTTWQVINQLLKNSGIYWRKLFTFLMVIAVFGGGYFLVNSQSNKTSAAFEIASVPNEGLVEDQVLDIAVTSDGHVLTETKNYSRNLKILPDKYEISMIVLDAPGVFIGNFKAVMHLPADVTQAQINQRVYAVHGVESHKEYMADSRTLVYEATNIDAQASFTIVADLPLGVLDAPVTKKFNYYLAQIPAQSYVVLAIILPLATLILLIFMVVRRRQDQIFYNSKKVVNLPPNDSPPAIVGALMDGKVGSREIAATLIDLARRKYLFITHHADGTFSFGKRKSLNLETLPELNEFERILLSKIFEPDKYKSTGQDVEMRIGRHIFSKKIAMVYLNIYNEATKRGYFVQNPMVIHLYWRFTGIGLLFLSLAGFFYTAIWGPEPKYLLFAWVGQMITASVIIGLSNLMPTRSVVGTTTLRQWMQFKKYLELNGRIDGGSTLEDRYNLFLPYAIVFGVEVEWTKRFMSETYAKPDWYESDTSVVTLETFAGELFPIISYIGESLDKSHEPTV